MQRLRKRGVLLSVLLLLCVCIGGCSNTSAKNDTLKIGVRDDIINFGYLNENTGKYYGLEIDIAKEMADRMGYSNIEFVTVTPDTRKEMLLNKEVDCIIATYSIASSREEHFDFSAPYYTDSTVLMVEKSTLFDGIEDLKEKNIGIVNGTNAGPLLANILYEQGIITDVVVSNTDTETIYEGARITKAEKYADLSVLLEDGTVDAVCMDKCIADAYMDNERTFIDFPIAEQNYGVAAEKGSGFAKEMQKTIQEMLDDGTIDKLIERWN